MNPKKKLITATIIIFIIFWVLDSIFDSSIFYKGHKDFNQLLLLDIPAHDLFIRLFFIISFTLFSFMIYKYIDKLERSSLQLEKTERRYHQVYDSKISMKMIINPDDGTIIDANQKAYEFFNLDKNDPVKNILTININFENTFLSRKFDNPVNKYHYQHRTASNEILDLEMHFSYIEFDNKNFLYCEMMDITEILKLQKELINISERERQAIGQELHDELGQILTGISYLIEVYEKQMEEKTDRKILEIKTISQLIDRAVQKTHQLSNGLRPVQIHQRNIDLALADLVIEIEEMFGLPCELFVDNNIKINDVVKETQIYYIAKESLYNAIKHANVKSIEITWDCNGEKFYLSIRSKGTKKNTGKLSTGMGISIMKYRARIIDANLSVIDGNNEFIVSLTNRLNISNSSN